MYFFDAFTINNQHFVQSLSSLAGLAFQTSAIFDLRILSFCIQQQISLLHVQEESVKSSLCHCQELLQASCTDPHVILKYLFWHYPNFAPLEEQLNILCTSLGWIARDMGVPDSYKFKVVCPVDLFFASLSNIQVILKGTNFDITGLKSSLYMIVDNKVVMVDGSEALHFEGHTIENEAGPSNSISLLSLTADARPSSATPHAISPSNTIISTNKASTVAADNANPLLPSNSIAFFSLPCLLTAPESDNEDKVLYTLLT
uniref:Uncharacterized protein n=1 Tax=Moniliophthora roreri TaxID=221103 RepID=A0A0W0ETU8_MONRR